MPTKEVGAVNGYPVRWKSIFSWAAVVLFGALLAGCGAAGARGPGAHDPEAQMRPELLEVSASPVTQGQTVHVRFPEGTERGVGWVLEEQDGDTWNVRYYLSATSAGYAGSGSPTWWSADDAENKAWSAVAIAGPGPDSLTIPDSIRPGPYRLCTVNDVPNICTTLDIAEQDQGAS